MSRSPATYFIEKGLRLLHFATQVIVASLTTQVNWAFLNAEVATYLLVRGREHKNQFLKGAESGR